MTLLKLFQIILEISFLGTITALVIIIAKKLFKNKISPTWHYLVWLILLIRLIVPYAPESSISIFNFFTPNQQKIEVIQSPIIRDIGSISIDSNDKKTQIKTWQQEIIDKNPSLKAASQKKSFPEDKLEIFNRLTNLKLYLPFISEENLNEDSIHLFHIAGLIWLFGVCLAGIYIIWVQISYGFKIKKLPICSDKNTILIYENCKTRMKTHRKIPLIMDYEINTPSLMGVLYPKIIISPDYIDLLTADELRYVFMHELSHYKQKDIIIRWILIILQTLHWFNPVLWFAFNKIRQDSETACDNRVLSYIKPEEYKKYGNTMLKMLDFFSGYNYQYGVAGMLNQKKYIMERVQNIVKFKKQYLIWSLVGIALFSGLAIFLLTNARKQPEEVIKIKYEAEEIAQEAEFGRIGRIKILTNGKILTYDIINRHFILIDNQGNKEDINLEGLPEDLSIRLFTVDSNDYIYAFTGTEPEIYVYNLEGKKIKDINLELKDVNLTENISVHRWNMKVDSKGNIYISIPRIGIQVFDPAGKNIKILRTDDFYAPIELDEEDNLYTITWNEKVIITKQNPLTGETLWQYEDDKNLASIEKAVYSKEDKALYLVERGSILKFDLQNQSVNKIISLDAILSDNFILWDFTINNAGTIYLCGINRQNDKGYLYKVNPKKIKIDGGIKTLTISIRILSDTLEYAINKFENQHPDIVINVENHKAFTWFTSDMTYEEQLKASEEAAQKRYDYVQKINTQMLTGKGPDILQLSSIPYRKYADKKLLLDLKRLMEKDPSFDKSRYYTNIFDALEYKNKLYIMPLSFSYPSLVTNTGFIKEQSININDQNWGWNDFIDVANQVTKDINDDGKSDMYAIPTMTAENLFAAIYNSFEQGFIDYESKEAYFSSEEFIDLLKMCRKISAGSFVNPDVTMANMDQGGIVFSPKHTTDFSIFYSNWLINADEVSFYSYPSSNKNSYSFITDQVYGINSRTKYTEEAWEFIKFLISEEIQSYKKLYGIPVNKKAREIKINNRFIEAEDDIDKHRHLYGYRITSPDKIKKQLTDNINKLNQIIPKLNNCNSNDIQVEQIINEEIKRFFNRERSAEETAQNIQRKVEMYFNE